jgi:hypothetical protein
MTSASSASHRFTRCPRVPSPDKNREWAASGIDRPGGRRVTFTLPTAIGSQMSRPPDLLLSSTRSIPMSEASVSMEEGRW